MRIRVVSQDAPLPGVKPDAIRVGQEYDLPVEVALPLIRGDFCAALEPIPQPAAAVEVREPEIENRDPQPAKPVKRFKKTIP